jgi:hypothetical protein
VEGWIQSAVIAVVISSLVTVAGWFVAHGSERRLETARRQEKIQDFQTALLADIRSTSYRFVNVDYDRHLDAVMALIETAPPDRPYTPFVPREPGSLLWPSIAQEVHVLPNEVIYPVVLFFSQLDTIRHFVDDLRSEQYVHLEKARKAAMYRDCIRMCRVASQLADEAQDALRLALGLRPLSSSGPVPLAPESASAQAAEATDAAGKSA